MNVYIKNKEENNDLKSGKNRCHYPAIFSLKIDCASFLSTYHSYYKIFSWKKFSREHVFATWPILENFSSGKLNRRKNIVKIKLSNV